VVGSVAAYRQVEVQSRSPLELVVLLYDRAIAGLTEANQAATRGDLRTRATAVSKALAIICALQETLNLDEGGAVAEELDRLYDYATHRLLQVNTSQDLTALTEVQKLLEMLRGAWQQIATQPDPSMASRP
jgi:flagellar protein FliS